MLHWLLKRFAPERLWRWYSLRRIEREELRAKQDQVTRTAMRHALEASTNIDQIQGHLRRKARYGRNFEFQASPPRRTCLGCRSIVHAGGLTARGLCPRCDNVHRGKGRDVYLDGR